MALGARGLMASGSLQRTRYINLGNALAIELAFFVSAPTSKQIENLFSFTPFI